MSSQYALLYKAQVGLCYSIVQSPIPKLTLLWLFNLLSPHSSLEALAQPIHSNSSTTSCVPSLGNHIRQRMATWSPSSLKEPWRTSSRLLSGYILNLGKQIGSTFNNSVLNPTHCTIRHGSSTFTHEAALAVARVAPESTLEYYSIVSPSSTCSEIPAYLTIELRSWWKIRSNSSISHPRLWLLSKYVRSWLSLLHLSWVLRK